MGTVSPSPAARPSSAARGRFVASLLFGAVTLGFSGTSAMAAEPPAVAREVRALPSTDREVAAFYRAQPDRLLWVQGGQLRPEAQRVLKLIEGAAADGLDPIDYRPRALEDALNAARSGAPADLARAETLLSAAFARYVRDLRRPGHVNMVYVDSELAPRAPTVREVLDQLAATPSVRAAMERALAVNPLYAKLRAAYAAELAGGRLTEDQQSRVRATLERLRALPADLGDRYVLVDAASARLWMYENGRPVDSMKVVIGRPGEPTPLMAAYFRHLTLNPYWNVPPDLVQRLVAPNVLQQGPKYLRNAGYQVMTDWSEDAEPRDASDIDWNKVVAGDEQLPLRQLPGPRNSMGRMKFMFPNKLGVYLHDTPNRELFAEADRRRSAGCVRLEDADRLARWLFGRTVQASSPDPEQHVPLNDRVPVYITYLTAMPEAGRIAFHNDHYERDRPLLARLGGGTLASAR